MMPIAIDPISSRCAPSVNASRSTSFTESGSLAPWPPSSAGSCPEAWSASGTMVRTSRAAITALSGCNAGSFANCDCCRVRTQVASSTAITIAGDSITTSATVR